MYAVLYWIEATNYVCKVHCLSAVHVLTICLLTTLLYKHCTGNFIEYGNGTLIYKKYASLYFIVFCDRTDNYIEMLEQIHHYVECLDKYFHNVCELDLIFNFYKTYFLMDEIFLYGHMGETSKKQISHVMKTHDNIYNDERIKMKK